MMGLITSTPYIAVFSAGTIVGITSTLTILKFLPKIRKKGYEKWEKGQEERFKVRIISLPTRKINLIIVFSSIPSQ